MGSNSRAIGVVLFSIAFVAIAIEASSVTHRDQIAKDMHSGKARPPVGLVTRSGKARGITQDQHSDNDHPCYETWENVTVPTPNGLVFCSVPSDHQLEEKLKTVGGYNRHYVAITEAEAQNFENLLTPKPTPTPAPNTHRTGHPVFRRRPWYNGKKRSAASWEEDDKEDAVTKVLKGDDEVDVSNAEISKRAEATEGIISSKKISCITRGQESKFPGYKHLCDVCQRQSELSIGRFPRYLNEITCESASGSGPVSGVSSCHIGIGKCFQGYMLIDLLSRTEKYEPLEPSPVAGATAYVQVWEPYTQKIRSCCDCRSFY
ncbi:uncharacterized protein LOC116603499 [Nematostella vectensis]|uniref:uncharacterized protein LOC116603499 n=1 Tax=Nematostella vectensis TaxID=45351 RepID=UPI002076FDFC|nr:uncharacterized protein LOC116603499 [Nematostella vectensis]